MVKKVEQTHVGTPARDDEAKMPPPAELEASYDMDGAGEFPVVGFEPLVAPKGVTLMDILRRLEALEAKQ